MVGVDVNGVVVDCVVIVVRDTIENIYLSFTTFWKIVVKTILFMVVVVVGIFYNLAFPPRHLVLRIHLVEADDRRIAVIVVVAIVVVIVVVSGIRDEFVVEVIIIFLFFVVSVITLVSAMLLQWTDGLVGFVMTGTDLDLRCFSLIAHLTNVTKNIRSFSIMTTILLFVIFISIWLRVQIGFTFRFFEQTDQSGYL